MVKLTLPRVTNSTILVESLINVLEIGDGGLVQSTGLINTVNIIGIGSQFVASAALSVNTITFNGASNSVALTKGGSNNVTFNADSEHNTFLGLGVAKTTAVMKGDNDALLVHDGVLDVTENGYGSLIYKDGVGNANISSQGGNALIVVGGHGNANVNLMGWNSMFFAQGAVTVDAYSSGSGSMLVGNNTDGGYLSNYGRNGIVWGGTGKGNHLSVGGSGGIAYGHGQGDIFNLERDTTAISGGKGSTMFFLSPYSQGGDGKDITIRGFDSDDRLNLSSFAYNTKSGIFGAVNCSISADDLKLAWVDYNGASQTETIHGVGKVITAGGGITADVTKGLISFIDPYGGKG